MIAARLSGGIPELQDRWLLLPGNRRDRDVEPPHRATLHRWIQGQAPRTAKDLLSLCGVLDIDPTCLLRFGDGAAERLSRAYLVRRWNPPVLGFIQDFLGRRAEWPPRQLARDYFGREWATHEVEHRATDRTNYYATLKVAPDGSRYPEGPLVYHVAFRHADLFGRRWLQYGWLLREGKRVELRHINGYVATCELPGTDLPLRVETWFGPSPAVFRLASLHPFQMEMDDSSDHQQSVVRFPG